MPFLTSQRAPVKGNQLLLCAFSGSLVSRLMSNHSMPGVLPLMAV